MQINLNADDMRLIVQALSRMKTHDPAKLPRLIKLIARFNREIDLHDEKHARQRAITQAWCGRNRKVSSHDR